MDDQFIQSVKELKEQGLSQRDMAAELKVPRNRVQEALKKLDFIVTVDLFMTPTAQYADVVLPAATFLEKDGIRSWWVPLQSINKAISVGDCRPDVEINFELAKRFDPDFKWKDIHELFDDIIKPSGLNFEQLQKKGWAFPPEGHPSSPYHRYEKGLLRADKRPGFQTPTGRFELYSTLREEWNLDPLPYYEEPRESPVNTPELYKKYPLILASGRRSSVLFHSEHRMIPWLREIDPDPNIEINTQTARDLGIENGEWVCVENERGRVKARAKVTPTSHPRVVTAAHGWWLPETEGKEPNLFSTWEYNINNLTSMGNQGRCGFGGTDYRTSLCRTTHCKVTKIKE